MKIDLKAIGERIREEREKLSLSREEFAEIIGLSDYYVGQLERGERQMSLTALVEVANCLHVSLDYLIFGEKPKDATEYVCEYGNIYESSNLKEYREIMSFLNKCSTRELQLFKQLIKTILPYINRD